MEEMKKMKVDFLSFIKSTLSAESLHYTSLQKPYENIKEVDCYFRSNASISEYYNQFIQKFEQKCKENTVFYFKDKYEANYTAFRLPLTCLEGLDGKTPVYFIIGPYLDHHLSVEELETIAARLKVPAIFENDMKEYYYNTRVLENPNVYYAFIEVLATYLFGGKNNFTICEEKEPHLSTTSHAEAIAKEQVVATIELLEQKLKIETELLEAISKADTDKAQSLLQELHKYPFGKEFPDPLRRTRNKGLSLNTLMKKTTEAVDVHPGYTEPLATTFIREIEAAESKNEFSTIFSAMVESYCSLIREHAMKDYPSGLKEIVNYIDFHFTEDLSLSTLSERFSMNPSYLSMLFKKKTQSTLTDYINSKRIDFSKRLLETTTFPINNIAREIGFEDVNYYTRLFRKKTGTTPRAFRKEAMATIPTDS
jgi:AraC-like DNA-binding protein